MKKMVWVFGQPGSGRTSIISELTSKGEVSESLDLKDQRIKYIDIPYDKDSNSSDYSYLRNRETSLLFNTELFSQDNNDVLLLRGEIPDIMDMPESMLNTIINYYPEIKQELLLLCPSDLNVLMTRLRQTEWFQKNYLQNIRKFPMDWLSFSVQYMRKHLVELEEYGCTLYDIDTTDGYDIKKHIRTK